MLKCVIHGIKSGKLISMGAAFIQIFQENNLNFGGYQLPVRRVLKSTEESNLEKYDKIPCLDLLIRLSSATEQYHPPLWYEGGTYNNSDHSPSESGLLKKSGLLFNLN